MLLADYLKKQGVEAGLISVFESVRGAINFIETAVRAADTGKAGTKNIYGEEQLALDVLADKIMQEELKKNPLIGLLASEELDDEMKVGEGDYAVCYDPLDGSSLVDVNLSVGTIVGIYKAKTFIGVKGSEQLASFIVVYGPATSVLLTVGNGVAKFLMNDDGDFVFCGDEFKVGAGKMFAPGNLRACAFRKDYLELLNYWCMEQYTLRYSGGMVPDVNQILLKGKGIFSYPGYEEAPQGKLRLLFECAPMALLMEQAGGAASDGKMRILDKELKELSQRTPIFIGSKEEVDRCKKYLF